MLCAVTSADEVDGAALALFGRTNLSRRAIAFLTAWEAWGVWANGGFEQVLTGGLADEASDVVRALETVGAIVEAALFEEAFALLPGDLDSRIMTWEQSAVVRQKVERLDDAVAARRSIKESSLAEYLDRWPEVRSERS